GGRGVGSLRPGRPRARACAAFRAREPDPTGRVVPGRGAVLHQRGGRVRQRAGDLGSAVVEEPGHPVPAGRAPHRGRHAAPADPVDGVVARPTPPHGGHPSCRHVQLPGEPPRVRGRGPDRKSTSELQSPCNLVCRLLLEKKKIMKYLLMVFVCRYISLSYSPASYHSICAIISHLVREHLSSSKGMYASVTDVTCLFI